MSAPTREELLDALRAVREAIAIPHAATVGDQEVRDRLLVERAGHAKVMLDSILDCPWSDAMWDVQYLREILANFPVQGYKTWDERVAELNAIRKQEAAIHAAQTGSAA